jgi:CHAD domain-containing protein
MNESNALVTHWKAAAQAFQKNMLAVERRGDHEAIHDARVAMKKLRSYAMLYDSTVGTTLCKQIKKFSLQYRTAGACRDTYNSLQLVKKFGKKLNCEFQLFLAYLQFTLQANLRYLRYVLKVRPILTQEWQEWESMIAAPELQSAHVTKSMKEAIVELWESIRVPKSMDDAEWLHSLRKDLKRIFYALQAVPMPERFSAHHIKEIRELNTLFGKWQDLHQLELRTKDFKENLLDKSTSEYGHLKQLLKAIEKEKESEYNALRQKLSSLLKID